MHFWYLTHPSSSPSVSMPSYHPAFISHTLAPLHPSFFALIDSLFDPPQRHGLYPSEIWLYISCDHRYPKLFLKIVCSVVSIGLYCVDRWMARLMLLKGMACIRVKFDYISPVTSDIPCCFLKIVFSVDQYSSYISAMSLVDISYSFCFSSCKDRYPHRLNLLYFSIMMAPRCNECSCSGTWAIARDRESEERGCGKSSGCRKRTEAAERKLECIICFEVKEER